MKQGYRLIIVDKAGVLVSEFQLTENALAQPEAFVTALKQSIEDIEEEESWGFFSGVTRNCIHAIHPSWSVGSEGLPTLSRHHELRAGDERGG